jgi:tripartite-type tricarboxylate transporter receptor subunit TctC
METALKVLVKFNRAFRVAAALLVTACAFGAQAQAKDPWPSKPIRFVVPFAAGGSIDVLARLTGRYLEARLGQPVVVENRTGAGGTVGADLVARAPADGQTFLFTAQGPLVLNPFLMKHLPYNAETAFAPVTVVAEAPNVLVANRAFPVSNFSQLLALGKSNPEKMTFGTQGVGTTGHVTGELIHQQTGLGLTHVAYQGFPQALTDVVAGRVGMMIGDTINLVPRIRAGQLRPIAIASARRSTVLPEVPTFAEAGYPEIVSGPWFAVLAPAGTSLDIRRKLSDEMRQILGQAEVQEKLKELGVESRSLSPEEFDAYLKSEYRRWGAVIRKAGITLEK